MLDAVVQIAREAGALLLRHYQETPLAHLDVRRKADDSPATVADRESNQLIVGRLRELAPDVPTIAEESALPAYDVRRGWRRLWLVDPLDGTREFLRRNGEFTVNVALVEDGVPVLGVLYAPARDTLYYAGRGAHAWKVVGDAPPRRITSRPPPRGRPLVVVSSRSHHTADVGVLLGDRPVGREIRMGSALKFGVLAEGAADVYVRTSPTSEWDVAAGDCIYRNSAPVGERSSPLCYNKPEILNAPFAIGLDP